MYDGIKYGIFIYFSQVADYEKEVEIMENVTKEEYLASLRR